MDKTLTAATILLACSVALSGCSNRPHLPPIFHIDEIQYWWEGPELIVSVTFTNQANFTPGIGALAPMVDVLVYKEVKGSHDGGGIGKETTRYVEPGPRDAISLEISPDSGWPWQKRWNRTTSTGPLPLEPGKTLTVEFSLEPGIRLDADDGYYFVFVSIPSSYPHPKNERSFQIADAAEYFTGCFNHDVQEFYGVRDPGLDCSIWDCRGTPTDYGYVVLKDAGAAFYQGICKATVHTGPKD